MEVLKDKFYRQYKRLSRYAQFPNWYNKSTDKYVGSTVSYLNNQTNYTLHKITRNDTWDSLALQYYNNPTYYWIITSYNRVQDPFIEPVVGCYIKIPNISTIEFEE